MKCYFSTFNRGERCVRCGYRLVRDYPNGVRRGCDNPQLMPCIYFGDRVRSAKVQNCHGLAIDHGIYSCDLHGECTPLKPIVSGAHHCPSCLDYIPDAK